jgi:hypothetical protein
VHSVSDARQIEMHTAGPFVPCPSPSELETVVMKLRKYKSSGSDQILAELILAGGETTWSGIHKLSNSIWNKEELPISGWSLLLYQFTKRVTKLTAIIVVGYHCYQLYTKCYGISFQG